MSLPSPKPLYNTRIQIYRTCQYYYLFSQLQYKGNQWSHLKLARDGDIFEEAGENWHEPTFSTKMKNELVKMLKSTHQGKNDDLEYLGEFLAFLGFIRFTEGAWMLLVKSSRVVANIGPHELYEVTATEMIPLYERNRRPRKGLARLRPIQDIEDRYLEIFGNIGLNQNFYYSFTYALGNTLQENVDDSKERRNMFIWNGHLIPRSAHTRWIVPMIHGYVGSINLDVNGRKVQVTLIARRSRYFAGTRYLKRGLHDAGWVANHVETEQIVVDVSSLYKSGTCGNFSSIVQVRGSIPVYWSQTISTKVMDPKPDIVLGKFDSSFQSSRKHFRRLFKKYGHPVICLDLVKQVERKPREVPLGESFQEVIEFLNRKYFKETKLEYISWDFKEATKKPERLLNEMTLIAKKVLESTGFFMVKRNVTKRQNGVLRTNCIDCLDRTGIAQSFLGKLALAEQLYFLEVISQPILEPYNQLLRQVVALYQKLGDSVALQYGGSQTVSAGIDHRGFSYDIITSTKRYYSNNFKDEVRQQAMNLLLGNFQFDKTALFAKHIWQLENDYYLHSKDEFQPLDIEDFNETPTGNYADDWVKTSPKQLEKFEDSRLNNSYQLSPDELVIHEFVLKVVNNVIEKNGELKRNPLVEKAKLGFRVRRNTLVNLDGSYLANQSAFTELYQCNHVTTLPVRSQLTVFINEQNHVDSNHFSQYQDVMSYENPKFCPEELTGSKYQLHSNPIVLNPTEDKDQYLQYVHDFKKQKIDEKIKLTSRQAIQNKLFYQFKSDLVKDVSSLHPAQADKSQYDSHVYFYKRMKPNEKFAEYSDVFKCNNYAQSKMERSVYGKNFESLSKYFPSCFGNDALSEKIRILVQKMRSELNIGDQVHYPKPSKKLFSSAPSLFELLQGRVYNKCFIGRAGTDWLVDHQVTELALSRDDAIDFMNILLDGLVIHHVTHTSQYEDNFKLYRIVKDNSVRVLNVKVVNKRIENPMDSLTIAEEALDLVLKLFSKSFVGAQKRKTKLFAFTITHYQNLYDEFVERISLLQRAHIDFLSQDDRKTFFINCFNCLFWHARLVSQHQITSKTRYTFYSRYAYHIGGYMFTLADLFDGVLRKNGRHGGAILRAFPPNDPRIPCCLEKVDCRVHFIAPFEYFKETEPIQKDKLNEMLEVITKNYLQRSIKISLKNKILTLPSLFLKYPEDFGSTTNQTLSIVIQLLPHGHRLRHILESITSLNKWKVIYLESNNQSL